MWINHPRKVCEKSEDQTLGKVEYWIQICVVVVRCLCCGDDKGGAGESGTGWSDSPWQDDKETSGNRIGWIF